MLKLLLGVCIILLTSCVSEDKQTCENTLFGLPDENTGLSDDECKPVCECKNYIPRNFTQAEIDELKLWELTEPIDGLESDPYLDPAPNVGEGICAIIIDNLSERKYHVQTFANQEEASNAGAIVTHFTPCALCSTLQDLAVYLEHRSLGTDVRNCSFSNLNKPVIQLVGCLEDIGFSEPCAQIWAYSAKYTQQKCYEPCIQEILSELLFNEIIPYNNSDGSLSPCINCDEELSGPVFKSYAGRSRRNSGIASGICRFCDGISPIAHDYPF